MIAIQHGKAIFNLQASFQISEPGLDHFIEMPKDLPRPETLPDFKTRMEPFKEQIGEWFTRPRPIDLRYIDADPLTRKNLKSPGQKLWMRADGKLPDDPVLHAVHSYLCQRYVVARHDVASTRAIMDGTKHSNGKPRPCDVVSSAI